MIRSYSLRLLSGTALTIAVMAMPCMNSANAQLPASAERAATGSAASERIQEQFMEDGRVPDVSPQVEVKDLVLQKVPEGAERMTLNLAQVNIEGATVYPEGELQALYANKIGQTVTLADIYGIATAMTNKYRNDGYILTQVIVPPQTIEDGIVNLRVVEGYVDQISVEGKDSENALNLIRTYASRVRTGRALNARDLERHLLLINDLPGVQARSVLSPSANQTGAADLRIIVTRDPYEGLLSADNFGSRYLGPLQLSAAGALNSNFGYNERITGQYVMAPDFNNGVELHYFAAGYEQPIGAYGTKLAFDASLTRTEPGYDLEQFDVNGESKYLSARVIHPFIRSRSENLYGRFGMDWRDVVSKNNLEPDRKDRITAIRAGARYEFLDTALGVGINSLDLELSKGIGLFGASDEGDANLTRPFGDPHFFKANADVQRLQRLTSSLNLLLNARGQWASDNLLSSEEFGIGGVNLGRGYDSSEIVGEHGVAGKIELQWNKPYQWNLVEDYQLYAFYDAGHVWNEDATVGSQKQETLTSLGGGIRIDLNALTEAGFGVALPLNRDVQTQNDQDPRFYFNVSRKF